MTRGDRATFLKELIRLEYNMAFTDSCHMVHLSPTAGVIWEILWVFRGRTQLEEINQWG